MALLEAEPLADIGYVLLGYEVRDGKSYLGLHLLGDLLAPCLAHRLLKERGVHLKTNGGDLPRLGATEQLSRAAYLQVVGGDLEAGPRLGELPYQIYARSGVVGKVAGRRADEVRVRPVADAAHPAPEH